MTEHITTSQMEVHYIEHMGDDLRTVDAARVSMKKRSEWEFEYYETVNYGGPFDAREARYVLSDKDAKLIDYLGRHHHKSPFNHNALTVYVKAPIFVARQLVKHEYLPMNEVSRRYVDDELEFYVPEVWRKRAPNKKQGSLDEPVGASDWTCPNWESNSARIRAVEAYKELLTLGVAPEQARMVLPQSLMSEWFWTGTLGAWAKMVNLRDHPDAQQETREVALMVDAIAKDLWPHSWEALRKYNVR